MGSGAPQQANPTPNVSIRHAVSAKNASSHSHPLPPASLPPAGHPPRPPLSEFGSDATVDDVMVIPKGADKEFSEIGGGGWKLMSRVVGGGAKEKDRIKMMRRRTTMDRSG